MRRVLLAMSIIVSCFAVIFIGCDGMDEMMGEDEDDEKEEAYLVDGSCSAVFSYGDSDNAPTFTVCISYNKFADEHPGDRKKACLAGDNENGVAEGTWSEEVCSETDITAKCKRPNEHGGDMTAYVYDSAFNGLFDDDPDDDDDFCEGGEVEVLVEAVDKNASLTLESSGTTVMCKEFTDVPGAYYEMLKTQFEAFGTWEEDGVCEKETGVIAKCTGVENETGFGEATYYHSNPTSDNEQECEDDEGDWAVI